MVAAAALMSAGVTARRVRSNSAACLSGGAGLGTFGIWVDSFRRQCYQPFPLNAPSQIRREQRSGWRREYRKDKRKRSENPIARSRRRCGSDHRGDDWSVIILAEQPDPGHFDPHGLCREDPRRPGVFPHLLLDVAELLILALLIAALVGPLLTALGAPSLFGASCFSLYIGVARVGESI